MHKLKQQFTAMTEGALLFWLPKFVAEEQWESLSSEQCASNLLWAEQGSKISQPGGYQHVQRPKVHSVLRYPYFRCLYKNFIFFSCLVLLYLLFCVDALLNVYRFSKVHSVLRYRKSENIRVANFHVLNFRVKKFS